MSAPILSDVARIAIKERKPFGKADDAWAIGYRTRGGSYVIANSGRLSDSGKPRDVAIISPFGELTFLSPFLSPEWVQVVKDSISTPELFPGTIASLDALTIRSNA